MCCDGSTVFDGRQQSPYGVSGYLVPIVRLRVEPFDYDRDMVADLRLVSLSPPKASLPEPLTGEFLDSKTTTVKQFRLWLKDCLGTHDHIDYEGLSKHSPNWL